MIFYSRDIPVYERTVMATFADVTSIMATGAIVEDTIDKLQNAVNAINIWAMNCPTRLSETNSAHINFTN